MAKTGYEISIAFYRNFNHIRRPSVSYFVKEIFNKIQ